MNSSRRHTGSELASARLRAMGYEASALVRDRGMERWWALARDAADRWFLVSVPDSLPDGDESTYNPTHHDTAVWTARPQWPPRVDFADVEDLILAIIRRRRTTTVEAQWDRRAALAYLNGLPTDERDALVHRLMSAEPDGWATLEGIRHYDANRRVAGRQSEAVVLLKETAKRMWPRTMTDGRLTQFGKRCGDEVFMVLPYESWASEAEAALSRAVEDPETTTGDTVRALILARPFDLSLLN